MKSSQHRHKARRALKRSRSSSIPTMISGMRFLTREYLQTPNFLKKAFENNQDYAHNHFFGKVWIFYEINNDTYLICKNKNQIPVIKLLSDRMAQAFKILSDQVAQKLFYVGSEMVFDNYSGYDPFGGALGLQTLSGFSEITDESLLRAAKEALNPPCSIAPECPIDGLDRIMDDMPTNKIDVVTDNTFA